MALLLWELLGYYVFGLGDSAADNTTKKTPDQLPVSFPVPNTDEGVRPGSFSDAKYVDVTQDQGIKLACPVAGSFPVFGKASWCSPDGKKCFEELAPWNKWCQGKNICEFTQKSMERQPQKS